MKFIIAFVVVLVVAVIITVITVVPSESTIFFKDGSEVRCKEVVIRDTLVSCRGEVSIVTYPADSILRIIE